MWVFLGRPRQKRSFSNILDRKENFLEQESEVQKHPKNRIFQVHGFCQKIELLPCVFFGNPRKKRSLFTILDRKEYF